MRNAALGWRTHTGWAVLVAVGGTATNPRVLARERVQLVDEPLPRMAYHAIEAGDLSPKEGKALVAKVRRAATTAATKAMKAAMKDHRAEAVGVVAKVRNIPDDFERILAAHALLHAAEGALYEEALVDAAARAGVDALLVEEGTIRISAALDALGRQLGPPWQKDHKLAAAAALDASRAVAQRDQVSTSPPWPRSTEPGNTRSLHGRSSSTAKFGEVGESQPGTMLGS